jgi:hypothetical protein
MCNHQQFRKKLQAQSKAALLFKNNDIGINNSKKMVRFVEILGQ